MSIETVLIPNKDRLTLCVSSEVGCNIACRFCFTGKQKLKRRLTAGQIVGQFLHAQDSLDKDGLRITNIVFMGMGEPLENYRVTVEVLKRLHEYRAMSARHLTVSTVGVAPAIERLATEGLPLTLAVSLHAANNETRSELIPLNRRYPLERLHEACLNWIATTSRRLSFEWALIDGVNDTDRAMHELADYARSLRAHVNLIPLNPTPGYLVLGSSARRVREFATGLEALDVNVTVRNTRGRSIDAACGQLAAVTNATRRSIPVRSA